MHPSRRQRIALALARSVVYIVAFLLVLVGLALAAVETAWGKNQLRRLILRQADQYLTASLEISGLEGSLLGGIELSGVRLSRDGRTLIDIDRVALDYSIQELLGESTSIRSVRLVRPRIVAGREADGRWDLASLVRRELRRDDRPGPRRTVQIPAIEIADGTIEIHDRLRFGAAHVPTNFTRLNTRLSFSYDPVSWRLDFSNMSWSGGAPDLTMEQLQGGIASGTDGIMFRELSIRTPRSALVVDGRIARDRTPTELDLKVTAERFAFQEWGGILPGLRHIAVESAFQARLTGPLARLTTDLDLRSNGGDARGPLVLNTQVPGWHGSGSIQLKKLNLGRWLNRPDRPSDITGRVDFDLDLRLGSAPVGEYSFDGSHAAYLGYEADRIRARGTLSPHAVQIADATALAYGATLRVTDGSVSYDAPYAFRFRGTTSSVDLRRLPESVPVPHVESHLAFEYDAAGRFSSPFLEGRARFEPSEFLGVQIGAGTVGTIDTSARPIRYTGKGDLSGVDVRRVGEGLGIGWMQDARFAGRLAGHFTVDGTGTDRQTMIVQAGGRLSEATLFDGALSDAAVDLRIESGSLRASYDGSLKGVNPALALASPRFAASLTGAAKASFFVRDLMTRSPELSDYQIDAALTLESSRSRGVQVDRGRIDAQLAGGSLQISALELSGPALDFQGSGVIEVDGKRPSQFDYTVARANLRQLEELLGRHIPGDLVTKGQLTGPPDAIRLIGNATMTELDVANVKALTTTADYDITVPPGMAWSQVRADVRGRATFVEAFNQQLKEINGVVSLAEERLTVDLTGERADLLSGGVKADVALDVDNRTVDFSALQIVVQNSAWRMASAPAAPRATWSEDEFAITPMALEGVKNPTERLQLSGTFRRNGGGALEVRVSRVFLDSFADTEPPRYGGVLDGVATIGGTFERPLVRADLTVSDGRVRQFSYQRLVGRVDYGDRALRIDARLDQTPGVWLTAVGTVPLDVFDRDSEQPMDLEIASSSIGLGLLEGLTTVVREVTGTMLLNVAVVGTSRDPHFTGTVELAEAAFTVTSSGARYRNGRASLRLASDAVQVDAFHLEDSRGRPLDVTGSLGTHELRVGDVEIDVRTKGFEVLRNEFGTIEVDTQLDLRGRAESPRLEGSIVISGGTLNVDEILDRTLFRPYSTEAAPAPNDTIDAVAALNPWDRLGLNIQLRIPGTLRMVGDELQVTSGTPIGLGDIRLRVFGELNLYKDPGDQLYVTGSFDSLTGTYTFQGRRFDIDPTSSINFHGDLNPELYVSVQRLISGIEARVTIAGPLREPELRLASIPPQEPSDILSLIVFGTPANLLTDVQQQELAVRAGTLAAGFLAAPLVGALERTLGLEILEIEAPDPRISGGGPRITIGDELLPGLVARFSRQFGRDEYDEATIEYYLSRILRIRATFSDAASLTARSPFRRTEKAGVDLILFFSF